MKMKPHDTTMRMTVNEAEKLLGKRPKWELQQMHRALASFQAINTEEENVRLQAVRVLLKASRK